MSCCWFLFWNTPLKMAFIKRRFSLWCSFLLFSEDVVHFFWRMPQRGGFSFWLLFGHHPKMGSVFPFDAQKGERTPLKGHTHCGARFLLVGFFEWRHLFVTLNLSPTECLARILRSCSAFAFSTHYGHGSKPMVPFWCRCTTHLSVF